MKGECLCQKICYECDELISKIESKHDNLYKRKHGAGFIQKVEVKKEKFRWVTGMKFLKKYEHSSGIVRYFCSICGCNLVEESVYEGYVIATVVSLDDTSTKVGITHNWHFPYES